MAKIIARGSKVTDGYYLSQKSAPDKYLKASCEIKRQSFDLAALPKYSLLSQTLLNTFLGGLYVYIWVSQM